MTAIASPSTAARTALAEGLLLGLAAAVPVSSMRFVSDMFLSALLMRKAFLQDINGKVYFEKPRNMLAEGPPGC